MWTWSVLESVQLIKAFYVHGHCMVCELWLTLEFVQSDQGLLCSWPLYGMWTLTGPRISAVWSRPLMAIVRYVNFDQPLNLCSPIKTFFVHGHCMVCELWSVLKSVQSDQGLLCSWPLYGMWILIGPRTCAVWSKPSLFMAIVRYVNFDWPLNLCSLIKAFIVHGHCMVCELWSAYNLCLLIKAFFVHSHCIVCKQLIGSRIRAVWLRPFLFIAIVWYVNFDRPSNLCSLIKAFFFSWPSYGMWSCELWPNLCSLIKAFSVHYFKPQHEIFLETDADWSAS